MKKGFFDIQVKPNKSAQAAQKLLGQLPKRLAAMEAEVTFRAAESVREGILQRTRDSELGEGYRDALQVAKVPVGKGKGFAYGLRVRPRAKRVQPVDAKKTILFVQIKASRLVPPKPEVVVLRNHGPWTMDTLPFVPHARDASLLSRKVSDKEAAKVEDFQRSPAQKLKVQRLLAEAGYIDRNKDLKIKTPPVVRAIPDLAFAGLRAEFGVDGERNPHWRPALRELKDHGLRQMSKSRDIRDASSKVGYSGWRRWPPRVTARMPVLEAKSLSKFEKRLRVR